jgi:hypothetical protein
MKYPNLKSLGFSIMWRLHSSFLAHSRSKRRTQNATGCREYSPLRNLYQILSVDLNSECCISGVGADSAGFFAAMTSARLEEILNPDRAGVLSPEGWYIFGALHHRG